jgi:hypothetical protein
MVSPYDCGRDRTMGFERIARTECFNKQRVSIWVAFQCNDFAIKKDKKPVRSSLTIPKRAAHHACRT